MFEPENQLNLNGNLAKECPTLIHLQEKAGQENMFGSPLREHREESGLQVYTYEDGSTLTFNSEKSEYHFLTKIGREQADDIESVANSVLGVQDTSLDSVHPSINEKLGEGKFSKVYSMTTANGAVAVKFTNAAFFLARENNEKMCLQESQDVFSAGRIHIHRTALSDHLRVRSVLQEIEEPKVRQPEFYGFSIFLGASGEQVAEVQFMESLPLTSIGQLIECGAAKNMEGLPDDWRSIVENEFDGDIDACAGMLVPAYQRFYSKLQAKARMKLNGDVGDINIFADEGAPGNVLVESYDPESQEFNFVLIDVTEYEKLLRNLKLPDNL